MGSGGPYASSPHDSSDQVEQPSCQKSPGIVLAGLDAMGVEWFWHAVGPAMHRVATGPHCVHDALPHATQI